MVATTQSLWRRCSNCKKEIRFGAKYSLCSVTSCTKVRAPTQFCSADCWAVHNEVENHKDAWAVEQIAPRSPDAAPSGAPKPAAAATSTPPAAATPASSSSAPAKPPLSATVTRSSSGQLVSSSTAPAPSSPAPAAVSTLSPAPPAEILIVASRFKDFVRDVSNGMSTSDQVFEPLSDHMRKLADFAMEAAKRHARKTVLGRDVPKAGPKGNDDILVVVTRLKEYVRVRADLRLSDEVPPVLSEELRRLAHAGIEAARRDGRKTLMGRDIPKA